VTLSRGTGCCPAPPVSASPVIGASDLRHGGRVPVGRAFVVKVVRTHGSILSIKALVGVRPPAASLLRQTNQLLAWLTVTEPDRSAWLRLPRTRSHSVGRTHRAATSRRGSAGSRGGRRPSPHRGCRWPGWPAPGLEVGPQRLHRVQVGRVRGELLDDQPGPLGTDPGAHRAAGVADRLSQTRVSVSPSRKRCSSPSTSIGRSVLSLPGRMSKATCAPILAQLAAHIEARRQPTGWTRTGGWPRGAQVRSTTGSGRYRSGPGRPPRRAGGAPPFWSWATPRPASGRPRPGRAQRLCGAGVASSSPTGR
jgi:hypothetical protein